jgi:hypothetical protein
MRKYKLQFALALTYLSLIEPTLGFQAVPFRRTAEVWASDQRRTRDSSRHHFASLNNFDYDEEDEEFEDDFNRILPKTAFGSEAVPEGQRPINEFLDLQRAPLFGWAALETPQFLLRLGIVYAVVFGAVCYPIAAATFTQEGYLLQTLVSANVGALSLILMLLLRF